jgi:hypothetical protein
MADESDGDSDSKGGDDSGRNDRNDSDRENDLDGNEEKVVRFPQSRLGLTSQKPFLELGQGPLAQTLGPASEQVTGHWCRYCRGIWYGYLLEVTCPRCGNRHG